MTNQNKLILTSVVLVGIGLYVANGVVPDSPVAINRVCARVLVQLDCADAKTLARDAADVPCVEGDVGVWMEVVGHKDWDEPLTLSDWLSPAIEREVQRRVTVLADTARAVDCATLKRPNKVLTPLRWVETEAGDSCICGCVSVDTSAAHDGSQWRTWHEPYECCGDRCRCDNPPCVTVPPMVPAGRSTCLQRWAEERPGLVCP